MKSNLIVDLNGTFNEHFYKKFTFILDNKVLKTRKVEAL